MMPQLRQREHMPPPPPSCFAPALKGLEGAAAWVGVSSLLGLQIQVLIYFQKHAEMRSPQLPGHALVQ